MDLLKSFRPGLSLEQLHLFTVHLDLMLKCGISLPSALHSLAAQGDAQAAECAEILSLSIERGSTFSEALRLQPEAFPQDYVRVMQAAEQGGHLDSSLRALADNLEKKTRTRQAIKSALTYPAFLLAGSGVLIVLMLFFIFPMVISVTKSAGVDPPALTRLLISVTRPQGALLGLVVIGLLGLAFKTVRGHRVWGHRLQLWTERRTPIGRFRVRLEILESTRQLSLLIASGVDLLRSLRYAAKVAPSATLTRAYEEIIHDVSLGQDLADSYKRHPVFPPMLIGILAVSAETGNAPTMLDYFCSSLEEDLNLQLTNVTAALEPVMLGVLGTVIGVLLIAAFMPIYDLIQV